MAPFQGAAKTFHSTILIFEEVLKKRIFFNDSLIVRNTRDKNKEESQQEGGPKFPEFL